MQESYTKMIMASQTKTFHSWSLRIMGQKLRLAGITQGCVNPGFLEGALASSERRLWRDRGCLKSTRAAPVLSFRLPSE